MLGIKVVCEANGKRYKYDISSVEKYASDRSNVFRSKVFSEILDEVEKKEPDTLSFDDRFTIYFISPSSKKEFELSGKIIQLRGVSYFKEDLFNRY